MNGAPVILAFLLAASPLLAADRPSKPRSPESSAENDSAELRRDTLVISDPARVRDATLRNGEYWGRWNFGAAQYLQVGAQPSTVYDTYRTVTLIRFDLSGLERRAVRAAKLRLYVPRNLTQQTPVPIYAHAVSPANAAWKEGHSEAEDEAGACSWNQLANGRPWAGKPGLAQAGVDYLLPPLASRTANGLKGEWLEFDLPKRLVQSWMNQPEKNAGLLIKTGDDSPLGQSTHLCSSQHWTGKGPQLVLEGSPSGRLVAQNSLSQGAPNTRRDLPPMGGAYQRWLRESASRYAVWAKDPSINLTGTQAVFPYLWDIIARGEIILPKAMLPLSQITGEIPGVVQREDRPRAREIVNDFMKYLMAFDYAREQNWYDSGPTVEFLSPMQIAKFFVKGDDEAAKTKVRGIYSQYDDGRWSKASEDDIQAAISEQLETIRKRLKPTAEQFARIEPVIRTNMPLEYFHRRELKKNLDLVFKLIEEKNDGEEMLRALRGMFFHHRLFLIHQSFFSMPKYTALRDNGDILEYANWFHGVRSGQYSHARIQRQYDAACRYMWKPSNHQEAEYAEVLACDWSNKSPGYSGTGTILFQKPGGEIRWSLPVATGGNYRLTFRYRLDSEKEITLGIAAGPDGGVKNLVFNPTAADAWGTNLFIAALPEGPAQVRLIGGGQHNPEIDYLDVTPISTLRSAGMPRSALFFPQPTPSSGIVVEGMNDAQDSPTR